MSWAHWLAGGLTLAAFILILAPTAMMFPRMRWCLWRHDIVAKHRLSQQSERLFCSCGRSYAINHLERIVLPWETVKDFYETRDQRPS